MLVTQQKRQIELDILRFAAIFAVIATHLCGGPVKSLDINSTEWAFLNCLRAAVTWDVPVFVMISGCLFLDPKKQIPLKKIYSKYIKHLILCFVFWSAIFQIFYRFTSNAPLNWRGYITEFIIGPYPFWYLFMLVGLYMIIPFLRSFTDNKRLMEYFIVLFIASSFISNYGVNLPYVGEIISSVWSKTNFYFALGFTGYYVLGTYLSRYKVSTKVEIALYVLGIICVIFSCIGTTWQSRLEGKYNEWFSKYLMPNVIIESSALYTLFVKRVSKINFSQRTRILFKNLSDLCFGVYLSHALIIEVLNLCNITVLSASPLIMVIPLTLLVYLVSLLLTFLIRKIPVVGKKIT